MDRPQPTKTNTKRISRSRACFKARILLGDFSDIQMAFHHNGDWLLLLGRYHQLVVSFGGWKYLYPKTRRDYEILRGKNPLNQVVSLRPLRFLKAHLLQHLPVKSWSMAHEEEQPPPCEGIFQTPPYQTGIQRYFGHGGNHQLRILLANRDGWSAYHSPWEMGDTGKSRLPGSLMGMISPKVWILVAW